MSDAFSREAPIDVFLTAFSATRGFVKPCGVRQLDELLWLIADIDKDPKRARRSEIVGCGLGP